MQSARSAAATLRDDLGNRYAPSPWPEVDLPQPRTVTPLSVVSNVRPLLTAKLSAPGGHEVGPRGSAVPYSLARAPRCCGLLLGPAYCQSARQRRRSKVMVDDADLFDADASAAHDLDGDNGELRAPTARSA